MGTINNELLELARLLRQQTQKDVAKQLGISQGKLSKAEQGLQELPQDVVQKLAAYYKLPINFFYRDKDTSLVGHLYFRRKVTVSAKVIDSFIAKVRIIKMVVDDIMSSVDLPDYTIGSYVLSDQTTVKDIADKVRYQLGIYRGPVPNLTTLLENNGIIIVKFNFGTDKLDGLSTITNKGYKIIFLNSSMPNDRLRYSLAHELGHMIMHLDTPPKNIDTTEDEANAFASQFLMPEQEIKPLLYNLNLRELAELKRRWRVSMRSLIRRAHDLEVINNQSYRNFQMFFSKKGYNKQEPVYLPIEIPTILSNTLKLYKEELGYSDMDLMNVMTLEYDDYSELFQSSTQAPVISLRKSTI